MERAGALRVMPLPDDLALRVELEKLRKKLADTEREMASIDGKLANESFVSKAPAKVVEDARSYD